MRVLFTAAPGYGHLQPMLPLAEHLRAAGHEVAVAAAPGLVGRVEAAGLAAFPAGLDLDDWFASLARRRPDRPWEQLPPERIMAFFLPHLFAEVGAPGTLADLLPIVEGWRPDLLIHDTFELAAPVAGRLADVTTVCHTVSPLPGRHEQRLTADAMEPLWRERGLPPKPAAGAGRGLCLDICPPSLRNPLALYGGPVRSLRPVPVSPVGSEQLPPWAEDLPLQPTVHITLGTSVTNSDQAVLATLIAGLRDEPLTLLVTVGPGNDPAALGDQPPNVHVERYLPHRLLLPLCDLVISHGGAGTMFAALGSGLPLLTVPQGADQYFNAELCRARGLGRTVFVGELSPHRVRSEVVALLGDAGCRQRARDVQDEIAAMPCPADIVADLERLAAPALDRG